MRTDADRAKDREYYRRNKEKRDEQARKWRQAHLAQHNEATKRYAKSPKGKARRKVYRQKHAERIAEVARAYRERHREEILAKRRARYQERIEKERAIARQRSKAKVAAKHANRVASARHWGNILGVDLVNAQP